MRCHRKASSYEHVGGAGLTVSSSFGLLAYYLDEEESPEMTSLRVRHAREHFQAVHVSPLEEHRVGDRGSGLIGWRPTDDQVNWRSTEVRGQAATAWLHIPSIAGGPESGVDSWDLASEVLDGERHPSELGAPFAVVRWEQGRLMIKNDVFGLVRLFHYRFSSGDVWTTRQGLAHVFMGETPTRNRLAWAGMAGLGWAPAGATHLGSGTQLSGGTTVTAGRGSGHRQVCSANDFAEWLGTVRSQPRPSAARTVADMEQVMSTAKRWPRGVIADLSGGKDSRVGAALGIRSESIAAVRTFNTDPGEVETARQLMEAAGSRVPHMVEERRSSPTGHARTFQQRLLDRHRAFEGRFLAPTAFNAAAFDGFETPTRARLNGLGGEVLAGGNFAAKHWRAKLIGAPLAAATSRLAGMASSGAARSETAAELVTTATAEFVQKAAGMGVSTAGAALDLFYALDKMPHWSVTFATPANICPLFAPAAIATAVHAMGSPTEPGQAHRELIREAIPEWESIPFFKPTFRTRATPPVWEGTEWTAIRMSIDEGLDASESFSPQGLLALFSVIEDGTAGRPHEEAILRFLWDQSFDDYLREVSADAARVRHLLDERKRAEAHASE